MKRIPAIIPLLLLLVAAFPIMSRGQVFPDFSKLNFGCDGDSITSGSQWSVNGRPGTEMNRMWTEQADSIASYLKILKDRHIPVLWRPYHEMNGEWFWWGWREGEKGFTALWKMMYDRFVNYHHLDNILWVWNANAPRDIPGDTAKAYDLYYPGNEYVDVLATDVYNRDWTGFTADKYNTLDELKAVFEMSNVVNYNHQ